MADFANKVDSKNVELMADSKRKPSSNAMEEQQLKMEKSVVESLFGNKSVDQTMSHLPIQSTSTQQIYFGDPGRTSFLKKEKEENGEKTQSSLQVSGSSVSQVDTKEQRVSPISQRKQIRKQDLDVEDHLAALKIKNKAPENMGSRLNVKNATNMVNFISTSPLHSLYRSPTEPKTRQPFSRISGLSPSSHSRFDFSSVLGRNLDREMSENRNTNVKVQCPPDQRPVSTYFQHSIMEGGREKQTDVKEEIQQHNIGQSNLIRQGRDVHSSESPSTTRKWEYSNQHNAVNPMTAVMGFGSGFPRKPKHNNVSSLPVSKEKSLQPMIIQEKSFHKFEKIRGDNVIHPTIPSTNDQQVHDLLGSFGAHEKDQITDKGQKELWNKNFDISRYRNKPTHHRISRNDYIEGLYEVDPNVRSAPASTPVNNRVRDAWLDEFRPNKNQNKHLSLKDMYNHPGQLVELATDQYGSRFIQKKLETAPMYQKQEAFNQLLPDTLRLCTDVFGNYVIQKFFEFGTIDQKQILASKLSGNVLPLSLQMYGCRVVQKAIDVSDVTTQWMLVRELVGHVMQCVKDQNGNHVIQKCIERVPVDLINFIVEAFVNQIYVLSTHPYGCRVIQRLLEHCSKAQRRSILAEILENTEDLCQNQYGNYVIQHVLIHGTNMHRAGIVKTIQGKILHLSRHKFASNVVEQCFVALHHHSPNDLDDLISEVLGNEKNSSSPLMLMMKDQYANYVIQRMIDFVDEKQLEAIIVRINRHIPNLRKIPYCKHIIGRIEKLKGKSVIR